MRKASKYPVVFFIFRRPDLTRKVLTRIIKSNPSKLYIFADGHRNKNEEKQVNETRQIVEELLNSNNKIEITKVYRKRNLGLKKSIIKGLNKVFQREDAAIILEDDCLPSLQFFDFCNLALYNGKDDHDINTVCGTNILQNTHGEGDCLISRYFVPWGWALWKRSWELYKKISDEELFSLVHKKKLSKVLAWYLLEAYKLSQKGEIKAWSYRMVITQIVKDKFSLYPPNNTVNNLGFGDRSSNSLFKTTAASLKSGGKVKKSAIETLLYKTSKYLDRQIAYKLYVTPISIGGLIIRKYFPSLMRYYYWKQ